MATVPCLLAAWTAHERELRNWLRHRLSESADADDLLQDVFIKALGQGNRFCAIGNSRAWLYEVARNALADRMRLARELVELPEDLTAIVAESEAVDGLAACLPRVLAELGAEDREAITLCDLDGLSQKEYARRKGLSLPGAKSRVQRARRRLRAQLTHSCRVRVDASGQVSDFAPRRPLG